MSAADITAQQMLDTIFEGVQEGEEVAVSQPMRHVDGTNPPWWTTSPSRGRFRKHDSGDRDEWYFCVSTVNGEKTDSGKGFKRKRTNLVRAHCLVLDDIGDPNKTTGQPPVEPDWIIETSANSFQWGYCIDPVDDLDLFEGCVEWTHQQGWGDKGAGGSYRVMRLVGSVNKKPGRGLWEAKLHHWEPNRGPLMELMRDLGCDLEVGELQTSTKRRAVYSSGIDNNYTPRDDVDDVLGWLSDTARLRGDVDGEWVATLCPNSAEHTSGSDVAYYSPLGRGLNGFVAMRTFKCHHEHCTEWDSKAFLAWVDDAGGPKAAVYDPMPWLLDRYALIADQEQFADMTLRPYGKWLFNKGELDFRHAEKVPRGDSTVNVSTAVAQHRDVRRVDLLSYAPGRGEMFDAHHQKCINVYAEPEHTETDRVPKVFKQHIEFLLPDGDDAEIFLNWLAFKVQNPARRNYAVLMVASGDYGVGRSTLAMFLKRVFGQGQVNNIALGQLIGKGKNGTQNYNDWASRCQLVVVEESKETMDDAKAFHTGYEEFKVLIDNHPTQMRINPKYGRTYTEAVYFNCLIFSNHTDAIALPEGDRRVAVFRNPDKRVDRDYYEVLSQGLNDREAAAAWWWLKRRDLSDYDPIYPPMTDAKEVMIEDTKSPVARILGWLDVSYSENLIPRNELEKLVMLACVDLNIDTQVGRKFELPVWRSLHRLALGKNGMRVSLNGKQTEIRAVALLEDVVNLSPEVVVERLRGGLVKPTPHLGKGGSKLTL